MTRPDTQRTNTLLASFTYQPGWTFTAHDDPEGVRLDIRFTVPDADNPGTTQTQCVRTLVPPYTTLAEFHRWLCWRLERIALHEVREFYRVNNVKVHDPHALPAR